MKFSLTLALLATFAFAACETDEPPVRTTRTVSRYPAPPEESIRRRQQPFGAEQPTPPPDTKHIRVMIQPRPRYRLLRRPLPRAIIRMACRSRESRGLSQPLCSRQDDRCQGFRSRHGGERPLHAEDFSRSLAGRLLSSVAIDRLCRLGFAPRTGSSVGFARQPLRLSDAALRARSDKRLFRAN